MKIDKNLNLVFQVERDDGPIYVHVTPISRDVFERYYLVLAKTTAAIFHHGVSVISGPKIAAMLLKTIAVDMGAWDGDAGVMNGLFGEFHRLANVVVPSLSGGWEALPLQHAISHNILDEDELAEVEGVIAFFISICAIAPRTQVREILTAMTENWGVQLTSSNSTAFARSLPTSIGTVSTGAKVGSPVAY